MKKKTTISLLGTGKLGFPLGRALNALNGKNYFLKASTTTKEKLISIKKENWYPYLLAPLISSKFNPTDDDIANIKNWQQLLDADILIISIPPKRIPNQVPKTEQDYPSLFKQIINLKPASHLKIIFTSSTSVYPNTNGEVDESTECRPCKATGLAIKKVEDLLTHTFPKTTIIRLGGIIGDGRGLLKQNLDGKISNKRYSQTLNYNNPMNYIHQKDAIGIILKIIEKQAWGKIFNGVAPTHPIRGEYYQKMAENMGLSPIKWTKSKPDSFKIVSSQKVIDELGYEFCYPDLLKESVL